MPRYIKQPHNASCAPTAIVNAGKWAGDILTIKNDYKRIYNNSMCAKDGTKIKNIDRVLRRELSHVLKILKIQKPTMYRTEKHIREGGAALISYSFLDDMEPRGEGCHIALYSDIWDDEWVGHNHYSEEPNSIVPSKEIIDQFYGAPRQTVVWLLKRKNI